MLILHVSLWKNSQNNSVLPFLGQESTDFTSSIEAVHKTHNNTTLKPEEALS